MVGKLDPLFRRPSGCFPGWGRGCSGQAVGGPVCRNTADVHCAPATRTDWLAGARDPEVGKTLALMHRNPAHPWTIADLAQQAGISRSVLAERFRHYLNEPPMAYLTRWRLQLGAQMLASTSYSVARIAVEVGYESEAAFNRAFKREFTVPPARFRSQSGSAHATSSKYAQTPTDRGFGVS